MHDLRMFRLELQRLLPGLEFLMSSSNQVCMWRGVHVWHSGLEYEWEVL